jgi:hypothetical protein
MVKTQIQLPDELYRRVKVLARRKEWSMAEILRRGAEHMVAIHPEVERAPAEWKPPTPRSVGIRPGVSAGDLRLLANERPLADLLPRGRRRR